MHSIFMEAINQISSFSFNNMNEDRFFFLSQELVLIYRLFILFCIDVHQFNLIMFVLFFLNSFIYSDMK